MDAYERHRRIWRFFYVLLSGPICRIFCLKHENPEIKGPCLIVANHVTDWDPLLLAMSFPRLPLYYVASEHIFRQGFISRVLLWLMEPIARRKGAAGTDTVKACLRHLKDGHAGPGFSCNREACAFLRCVAFDLSPGGSLPLQAALGPRDPARQRIRSPGGALFAGGASRDESRGDHNCHQP